MQATSENTKRIAKNTLMLYIRMLFSMAVSLFTTRVILDTLGASDYGISNLVGGVVGMMGIVTSLLSEGTTRFITIALGRNNLSELHNTFSASVTIHVILAAIILILGELIGPSIVINLNIPPDRIGAAQFVFQLSLIISILGIIQTPFHAAIVAHERMSVYAYISIWDVLAKLGIVYLLVSFDADKLKLYSALYSIVGVITAMLYVIYCRKHFEECRTFVLKADKKLYKDIFNYTGWNSIGAIAFTMNSQGITILLSAFGTSVNAARGIAGSVSGVVYKFVDSFQIAAKPQIVKLCAVGDFENMNNLIMRVSKFSSYLMGLIGIPLFLEMEYVLQLWLKDVPEYTLHFARLTLIQGFVQSVDFPIGAGIHAVGKMKLPNITSAFIYMAILPISYFIIQLGASPSVTYIVVVCVYPLAFLMDLYIINKYTQFPVFNYLGKIILPSIVYILVILLVVYWLLVVFVAPSFLRLVLTSFVSTLIYLPLVYFMGLTTSERMFVKGMVRKKLNQGSKAD